MEVLRHLAEGAEGLALVSVGGVETPLDLWERLKAGASLVQVYTGFVYGGPSSPGGSSWGFSALWRPRGFPPWGASPRVSPGKGPSPGPPGLAKPAWGSDGEEAARLELQFHRGNVA